MSAAAPARRRPITDAEYRNLTPQQRVLLGLDDPTEAAPTDFGGAVLPNPNHLRPLADTDSGIEATRLPDGIKFQHDNFRGPMGSDVSNPAAAELITPAMQTVGAKMSTAAVSPQQDWFATNAPSPASAQGDWFAQNEAKTPPEPQSAASRFGANLLSGIGVSSNEDAKHFFVHPLDTVIKSFEAQGELAKKARVAYDKGDYMGALQHGLNYLVPFIGQQTDQAGEQLKAGDIAGGIGRTLGAALPIVASSPGVQSAASDAARTSAAKGAAAVRAGTRGVNTVLAKAPGSVGATIGAAVGHSTGLPGMAEAGGAAGALAGRELLPKLRIPGEGFGLPSRVSGGPAKVSLSDLNGTAPAVDSPAPVAQVQPASPVTPKIVEQQLETALGGKKLLPGVSLRNQAAAQSAAAGKLPEGFTPVESTALKGYKYNPESREFESITQGGQHYVHGDVSPEEAAYFESAESKGKAWQQLRSQNPLVAKVVGGKRVAVKPVRAAVAEAGAAETPTSGPDLTSILQDSLRRVNQ